MCLCEWMWIGIFIAVWKRNVIFYTDISFFRLFYLNHFRIEHYRSYNFFHRTRKNRKLNLYYQKEFMNNSYFSVAEMMNITVFCVFWLKCEWDRECVAIVWLGTILDIHSSFTFNLWVWCVRESVCDISWKSFL